MSTSRAVLGDLLRNDACLHELFEEQAARDPTAIAISFGKETITYGELNRRSDRIAQRLRRRGVGPEALVGLATDRTPNLVIGMLGILKAGGAYVPLDPAYPADRLQRTIRDSRISLVVTEECALAQVPMNRDRLIAVDLEDVEDTTPREQASAPVNSTNLAYVIYTSGSTGQPKGVMVEHHNVCRLFQACQPIFEYGPRDVWTLFHSFAFDFSVWEIFGALLHGGRLVIVPSAIARSPEEFRELVSSEAVTILNQTPSAFRQLICADEKATSALNLRLVILGGEALSPQTLVPWMGRHGDRQPRIVNGYGITETTVFVTFRTLTRADTEGVTASVIGRPIPNWTVDLLDPSQHPVSAGSEGELFVGGAGVARGYLNRPELTAERFMDWIASDGTRRRLYRSGDLGRMLPSGDLEYLGRNDDQVKVRGYRIELGEIDAHLSAHPAVRESAVVARTDRQGNVRLVACVVPRTSAAACASDLRRFLAERLPAHAVPAAFVLLDRLPLTTNGKIDRKALPDAEQARPPLATAYAPPETAVEGTLVRLWAECLSIEGIGLDDDFFELGGDSFLAIRLLSSARDAGLAFEAADIHQQRTIRGLARVLALVEPGPVDLPGEPLPCRRVEADGRDIESAGPMTPGQMFILFDTIQLPGYPLWNELLTFELHGDLDVGHYQQAWQSVVDRHTALRTAFVPSPSNGVEQVVFRQVNLSWEEDDWRSLSPEEQSARLPLFLEAHLRRPFQMSEPPLFRPVLIRTGERAHRFCAVSHHIIVDGWSYLALLRDVFAIYEALVGNRPIVMRRAAQPAEVDRWSQARSLEDAEAFFRAELRESLPYPPLAPFEPGTVDRSRTHLMDRVELPLPDELTASLRHWARQHRLTMNGVLQSVWALVLGQYTGDRDLVLGTTFSGRRVPLPGVESMVGLLVNMLPVRIRLGDSQTTVSALATRLQDTLGTMSRYEWVSLMKIREWTALPFTQRLIHSGWVFQDFGEFRHETADGSLRATGFYQDGVAKLFPLFMEVLATDSVFLRLRYDGHVFQANVLGALLRSYEALLAKLVGEADPTVGECVVPTSDPVVGWPTEQKALPKSHPLER